LPLCLRAFFFSEFVTAKTAVLGSWFSVPRRSSACLPGTLCSCSPPLSLPFPSQVEHLRVVRRLLDVVQQMQFIVKSRAMAMSVFPLLTFQSLANEPDATPLAVAAASMWRRHVEIRPHFVWANKPQHPSPCVLTLTGHSGPVTCVHFAPTGGMLASGGADSRALIWDIGRWAGGRVGGRVGEIEVGGRGGERRVCNMRGCIVVCASARTGVALMCTLVLARVRAHPLV
jgi:WD40 repeat protein